MAKKKTTQKSKQKSTTTTNKNKEPKTKQLSKTPKRSKRSKASGDDKLVDAIVKGMQEKKAKNISVVDMTKIENNFCNYFVICEADSKPQLQAITNSIEETVQKKLSIKPHHVEGIQNAEWILLDYLTVIVHVFRGDIRDFYKIENFWADAHIQNISDTSS